MRRLLALALALGLLSPGVIRAQEGKSSDPAMDTVTALELIKRGRYEDAITSCRRALQRDERYVPALMAMAKAYYYLKKYELSTAIIEHGQKLDPSTADGYHLMGFIALSRSDSVSATAAFKKAVELKPDYGNAWNNLAAQYLLAKNYEAAATAAEKAVEHLPSFDKAHLNLGSAYRGKAQYTEAEREYRKALELNPAYADAYFNLGILYLDAPKIGELDVVTKLNTAIGHLSRYKNLASYRLRPDDPADGYVEEARKGIDREQKRLQRLEKQKERERAKQAAPPATPPAEAPPVAAPAEGAPQVAPPPAPDPNAPRYEGPAPSVPPPAPGGQP